ncbi:MAG: regulatory iron-sulfur-containing complex subunit RicT [Candidatus Marinimicrobia bacterium]|jgi:cell fate regulator YaaT (PSP1 superfamily)|nr:regulatory iron-sulfur-containing complex subunit RicT [Candidatus Neomarinimicrobiota bacterium]
MKAPKLIKIEFKGHRREYFKNPLEYPIQSGDYLLTQTEKGEDIGIASSVSDHICPNYNISDFNILRKANNNDIEKYESNKKLEKSVMEISLIKIKKHGINMKLTDVEYQLDCNKLTFYYTANKRIDFRELVKILAGEFKTRIEMRQIGVRDETKRMDIIGPCGLPLCCEKHLEHFTPVDIKLAKEQNLPMSPSKLSGLCGKLKCCLNFEKDLYRTELEKYPPIGEQIIRNKVKGHVSKINILTNQITCDFQDDTREYLTLEEVLPLTKEARNKGLENLCDVMSEIIDGDENDFKNIEDN